MSGREDGPSVGWLRCVVVPLAISCGAAAAAEWCARFGEGQGAWFDWVRLSTWVAAGLLAATWTLRLRTAKASAGLLLLVAMSPFAYALAISHWRSEASGEALGEHAWDALGAGATGAATLLMASVALATAERILRGRSGAPSQSHARLAAEAALVLLALGATRIAGALTPMDAVPIGCVLALLASRVAAARGFTKPSTFDGLYLCALGALSAVAFASFATIDFVSRMRVPCDVRASVLSHRSVVASVDALTCLVLSLSSAGLRGQPRWSLGALLGAVSLVPAAALGWVWARTHAPLRGTHERRCREATVAEAETAAIRALGEHEDATAHGRELGVAGLIGVQVSPKKRHAAATPCFVWRVGSSLRAGCREPGFGQVIRELELLGKPLSDSEWLALASFAASIRGVETRRHPWCRGVEVFAPRLTREAPDAIRVVAVSAIPEFYDDEQRLESVTVRIAPSGEVKIERRDLCSPPPESPAPAPSADAAPPPRR